MESSRCLQISLRLWTYRKRRKKKLCSETQYRTNGQMYAASVFFAGQTRRVLVGEAPTTPLVGTDLLRSFVLRIEFWDGGQVEIRERPGPSDL